MNKEFLKMQKLAGLITENQMREMMDDEKVPLTPEIKQYIDDAIAELRNSQSDEEWAGLERAEFWGNEFGEGVWEHFQNKYPEALDVSQEVYDYIFDKVAEYDNQVNEISENTGKRLDQEAYMEALNLFFDALGNGANAYDDKTWGADESLLAGSIAHILNKAGVDIS